MIYPSVKDMQQNTRDLVVEILSYTWPLSVKKIYHVIKSRYNKPITYQAVYKTIKDMVNEGTLLNRSNEYLLDLTWINNLKEFCRKIESSYSRDQPFYMQKGLIKAEVFGNVWKLVF